MKRIIAISALILTFCIAAVALYAQSKINTRQPQAPNLQEKQTATPTPTPSSDAILSVVTGGATLTRDKKLQVIDTTRTERLIKGDVIATKPQSVAAITYSQGMVVRLGPDSSITFESQEKIFHRLGSFYVRFKKILGFRESLTVETPTAVASVRGSAFASFVDKNTGTKIAVSADEAFVKPTASNTAETTVDEQHQAMITAKKQMTITPWKLTNAEEQWIDFNTSADDLLDREDQKGLVDLSRKTFPTGTPAPLATPKPAVQTISAMPGEGLTRSTAHTDAGDFPLSCYGANKSSINVVTDAANDDDCTNDCSVKSLAEFASAHNGVAAMNGMYFCPAEYPACSDKKNSFDTLFFITRLKKYLNSTNNVYSTLPWLAVESNGNPLFYTQTLQWGRDAGIQAGMAGHPLLVKNGAQIATEDGLDEKQKTAKGPRGAFVQKGDMLYLCTVGNATVLDSAKVYTTLSADNAINIDGGGSTALWVNGSYIFGPGRNIPTAIIFARK